MDVKKYLENYRKTLIKTIYDRIAELDPEKKQEKPIAEKCPVCGGEYFMYYPEYEYGHCHDCGYEQNLEEWRQIEGGKKEIFLDIFNEIINLLGIEP